ncbi:MAG: SAM-dependent DNA methyltransferase [Bacteroidetes bacterium]|nr:SAM-dependent DNA methyltransferase [Bacteroidota bacterium]
MLTNPALKSQVDALWNRFWSGGISNPLTAIEQMSYLIFLKRLEDMDNARAAAAKRRKTDFKSVFIGKMDVGGRKIDKEKCRWSYWSQLPGDEMLRHVRDTVFEFLRNLGSETSSFTQHMEDAMFSIPKASLLQEAVKIIDDMHISEQNIDVQGDLYEYLLGQLSTAGKNGQFRTPRHIIRMMTKLIDPKIGERICDPAAGTAGFLVSAYEHILESNTSPDILTYDEEGKAHNLIGDKITNPKLHEFLKSRALTGFDFDATMVRMGAMNLMLHGVDNPNFKYADALSKQFSEKQCYDVILANPPFKGSIDESDVNERFSTKTSKTELLFVELIYDLLVTGGRAVVIVPDGVLFGTSNAHQGVRQILVDKCKLEGIISMPSGVFKPYAGVSTAVLIFTKGGITDKVWFYDMSADGFSLDDKRQKISENDISDILKKYPERKTGKNVVLVKEDEIRKNKYDLSISRYKEVKHEVVEYEKPEKIMDKILMLEEEIADYVKGIKKSL